MAFQSYKVEIEFDIEDMDENIIVTADEIQKVLTKKVREYFAADNVEVHVEELEDEDDED